jgi:hypothetical protein
MTPTQEVDHTLDNLSRMLADESVSRSRALRLLGAALVGGLLASIPGGAKAAPLVCTGDFPQECGDRCCSATAVCCGHGANAQCCNQGEFCCGKGANQTCCDEGWTCCQKGQAFDCCPPEQPICCLFPGRDNLACTDTVASCEAFGGRPR